MTPTVTRTSLFLLAAALGLAGLAAGRASLAETAAADRAFNAELAYLTAVNDAGPAADPRMVFLLMAEYANAGREPEGIAHLERLLGRFDAELTAPRRALYLSALGILRAGHADEVFLLRRIGWVRETLDLLDEAKRLTGGEAFLPRFASGVVGAQLPGLFGRRRQAIEDLEWLVEHAAEAPDPGMMREVYFQLAGAYRGEGEAERAAAMLARSGSSSFEREIPVLTSSAVDARAGHTFHPLKLTEVVPGRVFSLSGFEFTEYHFVVTANGEELVSIDAGTRPDSARAAYEHLRASRPGLPPLTTVLVTHAHWDHVGGHRFFRSLDPPVEFISRDNWRQELDGVAGREVPFEYFFGSGFRGELIRDYAPDRTVVDRTEVEIGGTAFDLVPIAGGETVDGMLVHVPELGVLFVGDFIMPFLGAPMFEEGSIPGLLDALDTVVALAPEHLLHGHEPLTRNFDSPALLAALRDELAWLDDEVRQAISGRLGRTEIHRLNLIPPALLDHPETHLPYLILRENFINRAYDQQVGYWGADLDGMDHLGREDYGVMLTRHLGLSESRLAAGVERMIEAGDHHLAQKFADWGLAAHPGSPELGALHRQATLLLKQKYELTNPFKFIIYSEIAGHETPQLEAPADRPGPAAD